MKKLMVSILSALALTLSVGAVPAAALGGCASNSPGALNPADYPDPPEDQLYEVLPIYMAWDGAGGETWEYRFSKNDIIEESAPPPSPKDDENTIYLDDELPGGRTLWFKGVSPGDLVVTFTTKNDKEKVVDIQQYAIRVFEDLRLAMLHYELNSFRD